MEPIICPRCQEPFGRAERFCKNCGIRKGKSISKWRWWMNAIGIDLLLTGVSVVIREIVITARGYPMDHTNGVLWLMVLAVLLSLVAPTICIHLAYVFLLLKRRGVKITGTVTSHYIDVVRGEDSTTEIKMSRVTFTPEIANASQCWAAAEGWLPIGSTVEVTYDPYNPREYARVEKWPLLFYIILWPIISLLAAAPAIALIGILLAVPFEPSHTTIFPEDALILVLLALSDSR